MEERVSPTVELALVTEELRRLQNSMLLEKRYAFDEGYEACRRGDQKFRNPYRDWPDE